MKKVNYRVIRMAVSYKNVEEEVMFGIEAVSPEDGRVVDRICRISENEDEVHLLSDKMNRNELSQQHFRCAVADFRQ